MGTTYGIATVVARSYMVESIQLQLQKGAEVMSLQVTENAIDKSSKKAASVSRLGDINQSNVGLKKKSDSDTSYTKQGRTYANRTVDIII